MRGTPGRGQGRGNIPFANTPTSSAIPRPVLENTHTPSSDAGAASSSLSASRQKQTKRDEVGHTISYNGLLNGLTKFSAGHPPQDGE